MKKRSRSSMLLRICVLFTMVIILSVLTIIWLVSKHDDPRFAKWSWLKRDNSVVSLTEPGALPVVTAPHTSVHAPTLMEPPTASVTSTPPAVPPTKVQLPITQKAPVPSKQIHFIHIPKCGGTTMTTLLRQMQCAADPVNNADCCLNPGFCDWHAHRRCSTIQGCINHFPNRKLIYKPMPSIAVVREPISRLLSAWFYRGHSPNLDFFQVRPEFKDIKDGKRPRVVFSEYLEMPEYQNIQTRMLGADSFPYRNITITDEIFAKAVDALAHIYFVGLQEEFQVSSEALIREMGMSALLPAPEIKKEREVSNARLAQDKADIKGNEALMRRAREVNSYDIRLYAVAVEKFCTMLRGYPDLFERVQANNQVKCSPVQ